MRTFEKSKKLDNVCYDVRGPVVDEANRMIAENIDILKLNIGNPAPFGFQAPDEVIHDMQTRLREAQGYSDSKGVFGARKAIMQYCRIKKIPNVTMEDIYVGNGVSELITMSMQGLLDDGDEILIPSPDYPLWTAAANLAGGRPVHYICDESADWYPDLDDMEKKITDRTKGLVIINPNNPTGALYPKELLERIVDIARRHELILFADEIYDRLVMDGEDVYKRQPLSLLRMEGRSGGYYFIQSQNAAGRDANDGAEDIGPGEGERAPLSGYRRSLRGYGGLQADFRAGHERGGNTLLFR